MKKNRSLPPDRLPKLIGSETSSHARSLLGGLAALALLTATGAWAGSIGLNFVNNGNGGIQDAAGDSMIATDEAGAPGFVQGFWNNLGRWGAVANLNDSTGIPSGVGAHWDGTGVWNNGASTATADGKLMNGYLDSNADANVTLTTSVYGNPGANKPLVYMTNLVAWLAANNACSYNVVIYSDGDVTSGRIGEYWLVAASGSGGAMTLGGDLTSHVFIRDNANFAGTYTRVPLTSTTGAAAANGNYAVFTNLTADSFLLRTEAFNTRAPINALQIWPNPYGPPAVNSSASSQTNYGGQTVQLAFSASSCTPITYQWKAGAIGSGIYTNLVNGGDTYGADGPTLTLSNAVVANSADYVLVASNDAGTTTSEAVSVTVVPAIFTTQPTPASAVVYPGATTRFRVATLATSPSYQWRRNGAPLSDGPGVSGATTNLLVLSNVDAADAGSYDVVVTTPYGSVTSTPATLSLLEATAPGTFAEAVVTNKALAYWRFGETTGPTALDSVGGFNGTYLDASLPNQLGPQPSDFLGFESTNISVGINPGGVAQAQSWVTVPALNMVTNTLSIVAWVYPVQDQQAWTGILMTRSGISGGFGFSGTANELAYTWNNDTTWVYHSGLIVPNNQWSMVALVMTATNTTIYLGNTNSGLVSWANPQTNMVQSWTGPGMIGSDQSNTARTFAGYIDEVAVFDHSLSPTAVVGLYAAGRALGVLAPSITAEPAPVALYPGRTARFTVAASGTEPLSYQWRKGGNPLSDGGNISGATSPSLVISGVASGDVADYDVIVSNTAGTVTSRKAALSLLAPTGSAYEAAVIAASPYAYWRLNEASGNTNAFDAYGSYTGAYGPALYVGAPGPVSPAFSGFENNNSAISTYLNVPGSYVTIPPLNLDTNTVTITAWIFPVSENQTNAGILFQRQGLTVAGLSYDNFDGTRLGYNWNDAAGAYNFNSGLYLPALEWSFVAVVVEPTKATLYLYTTNTQFVAANRFAHVNQSFAGLSYIGNDPASPAGARIFNGTIDEVAVWNRALTGDQIAALYSAASGAQFRPAIALQPQDQTLYVGMPVQFTASAAGTPTLTYRWQKNGTPLSDTANLSGTATPTLNITSATLADVGGYALVAANNQGSVTSRVATLSVLPESARIVWSAPAPITTADSTLGLPGTPAGAAVFGTAGAVVSLPSGAVFDFKADGSVATATGNGNATGAFAPNTTGNTNFDAVLNQFRYDGGPKTITVNGLIPGHQYTVQLFALDNRPDNVQLSRRAYFQDPFDTNSVSATFYMSNNVYVVGTFTASATSQTIRQILPGLDGGTAQVGNGNINALVIRDLSSAPAISSQPASVTRYVGAPAALTAVTYGAPPMSYQWQKGTAGSFTDLPNSGIISILGSTTLNLSIPAVSTADAADYRLIIANSSGSVTSAVATLTVITPPAGTYAASVVSYGPLAYWRFNEPAGSTVAYDYAGGYNATHTAVTLVIAGPAGNGLETGNTAAGYDGLASASATASSLLNNRSRFTLAGWFNMATTPAARTGLFGQNDTAEFGFHNTTSFGIWTPNGGYLESPIAALNLGQWYHVTAVANGTGYQLYLNGALVATGGNATTNYGSSASPFRIGGGGILDGSGNFFNGALDEIAVFDYALSPDQVRGLYLGAPTVVLNILPFGGNLQLTWDQGILLQADSITGPWTTNSAANPPAYTVTPSEAKKFYRVIVR